MRDGSTFAGRLWTLCKAPETWGYLAVLVLCVVSIRAYTLIPGWSGAFGSHPNRFAIAEGAWPSIPPWEGEWGLDFQNLYTFHHCGRDHDLYAATGHACGDWLGRAMLYPPVLYWSFYWTRAFSFP